MAWTDQCRMFGNGNKAPDTVYFIQSSNNLIKIGASCDVDNRFKELCKISPIPLTLLKTIDGSLSDEKELHEQFKDLHSHGEWFKAEPRLMDYIKQA